MKRLIFVLVFCAVALGANAQGQSRVKMFEFEAGIGAAFGSGQLGLTPLGASPSSHSGMFFFLEPRINIIGTPFDVGLQLSVIGTSDTSNSDNNYHYYANHKPALVTFVDYNFRSWRKTSLFCGLGAGMSAVDWEHRTYKDYLGKTVMETYRDRSFVLNPRIGAEFFHHLRLTLEYKWMAKEYSFFGLTVGGVFGGGRKR